MGESESDREPRRSRVIDLVQRHRPGELVEARSRALLLTVLQQLDRPFDREAQLTHLTASAIVAGPRGTVLHVHKRLGLWLQPGGHIDAGEEPEDAALREVREETGLDAEHPATGPLLVHVDAHPALDHLHLDLRFLVRAPDRDPQPEPGESPEVRWFSWEEALAAADPSLAAALRATRSRHPGHLR